MGKNSWKQWIEPILWALLLCFIPFDHRYDRFFQHSSLCLPPLGLELPYNFDRRIFFYPSDFLAIGLFLWAFCKHGLQEKSSKLLFSVFILAVISVIASPLKNYPIAYIRLLQLFTPFAFFYYLSQSSISKKHLFSIASWSLFSLGLFQAIVALLQYFTQNTVGLRILNEHHHLEGSMHMQGSKRWLLDLLMTPPHHEANFIYRTLGTLPHPNTFGGFLMVTLVITGCLFHRHRKYRFLIGASYFLQLLALATTFSRSAILAYLFATTLFIIWTKREEKLFPTTTCLWIASFGLLTGILFHEQYSQRAQLSSPQGLTIASFGIDHGRIGYQDIALKMIQKHPFLGVGYQQFPLASSQFLPPQENPHHWTCSVHNIYLLLAAETGIISCSLFLLWIFLICFRAIQQSSKETTCFFAAFCALLGIGLCDLYPITAQPAKLLFFSLAAILVCMTKKTSESFTDKSKAPLMFDRISKSYDLTNLILSFGLDQRWRRSLLRYLPSGSSLKLLDVATGTGDQIAALLKPQGKIAEAVGIDLSSEMLKIAEEKQKGTSFQKADAENLPFADSSFDVCTCSFGIRNMQNPGKALREFYRVTNPQGRVLILEFSLPRHGLKIPYLFYLRHILPFLGGLISRDFAAYRYLNKTIETFPSTKEFVSSMQQTGWSNVRAIPLCLGAVTLYTGDRV